MTQRYFAITTPGFEKQVADEIDAVGGRKIEKSRGGVEFDATHRVFYRSNYEVRSANRIYLRVDEFRARDFPELYNKTRRFGWERLLGPENRVFIKGVSNNSHLVHTDRIAETVAHGLREHFTEELGQSAPEIGESGDAQYLLARLSEDRCQLSLDASGELLFKRGWRTEAVEAPIRETLAAAILQAVEWSHDTPLVDPMCGSGTFVIEAAWIATGRPPGDLRDFAFHRWANFRPDLWEDVVEQAHQRMRTVDGVRFFGYDADAAAVDIAQNNAARAEAEGSTQFARADIGELAPPAGDPGLVVANPPYGERLEESEEGEAVYKTLIERFARAFKGWRLAVVLPRDVTPSHSELSFDECVRFRNGGLPVRLWTARHR